MEMGKNISLMRRKHTLRKRHGRSEIIPAVICCPRWGECFKAISYTVVDSVGRKRPFSIDLFFDWILVGFLLKEWFGLILFWILFTVTRKKNDLALCTTSVPGTSKCMIGGGGGVLEEDRCCHVTSSVAIAESVVAGHGLVIPPNAICIIYTTTGSNNRTVVFIVHKDGLSFGN